MVPGKIDEEVTVRADVLVSVPVWTEREASSSVAPDEIVEAELVSISDAEETMS